MAGKFADNAWIDDIVSFITREWHILQIFGEFSTAHSTQIQSYRHWTKANVFVAIKTEKILKVFSLKKILKIF